MALNTRPRTVGAELQRLFPEGTIAGGRRQWAEPPVSPTDLFVAAAYLLEGSGAYQFLVAPFSSASPAKPDFEYGGQTRAPSQVDVAHWTDIGRRWAANARVRSEVVPIWQKLWEHGRSRFVASNMKSSPVPDWWGIAHSLPVIADEACAELGYTYRGQAAPGSTVNSWHNQLAELLLDRKTSRSVIPVPEGLPKEDNHYSRHVAQDSLSELIDRDVVRVLPKGRTTEIGCTPRTFSHNLALLPAHGHPNAYWHPPQIAASVAKPDLNLLLIPYPYHIPEGSFRGLASDPVGAERPWGRFRIDQRWLRDDGVYEADYLKWSTPESRKSFVAFVDALIERAQQDGQPIHGVVLPEYATDWYTYDAVVRHLRDKRFDVEFVVGGVSVDCNRQLGNQVTFTTIYTDNEGKRLAETHSRRKHHRWMLDDSQTEAYGLRDELPAGIVWWEHLEIEERVMHIDVFRSGSTLTSVICEDLARVDPGLSLLRQIGPSMVFALLMDGPQMEGRWPGVYATGLTDDPGSSVLSLTSLALVDRSNASRKGKGKSAGPRSIALWKNKPRPTGVGTNKAQLELADASLAVKLTVTGEAATECTTDGRPNSDAAAWYYKSHAEVGLTSDETDAGGWKWIVGEEVFARLVGAK